MEDSHSIFKRTHYPFESNPFDFEPNEICPDEMKLQGISNMSNLFSSPLPRSVPSKPDADSIKMFVGQIPPSYDESHLLQLFESFGKVYDLKLLRNQTTRKSKGCCFVTFFTRNAALNAQNALHNIKVLPGMNHPIQMKPADVENHSDKKLFIGMLPKHYSESDVRTLFSLFGAIEECTVLRNIKGESKGCAFVTYLNKQSAHNAIHAMHHSHMFEGCSAPILVRFADTNKDKELRKLHTMLFNSFLNHNGSSLDVQNLSYNAKLWLLNHINVVDQPLVRRVSPISSNLSNVFLPGSNLMQINCPRLLGSDTTNQHFSLNDVAYLSKHNMSLSNNIWCQLYDTRRHVATENKFEPQIPSENYFVNPLINVEAIISKPPWEETLITNEQKQIKGPEGANIFIYHLPHEFNDGNLFELFQPYGHVLSAKVFVDKNTKQSKCFGFVSYDNILSASVAIQNLNGYNINGKRLKVEIKKKKTTQESLADISRPI